MAKVVFERSALSVVPKRPKATIVTVHVPHRIFEWGRVEECSDELECSQRIDYEEEKVRRLLCGDCGTTLSSIVAFDAAKIEWFCPNGDCISSHERTGLVLAQEDFHSAKSTHEEKNVEGLGNAPEKTSMWDKGLGSHGWQSALVQRATQEHNTFNISTRPGRMHMEQQKQQLRQQISTNTDDPRLHYARELFKRHKKAVVLGWSEDRWEHHTSKFCALLKAHMEEENPTPSYDTIRESINAYLIHVGVPPLLPDVAKEAASI